MRSRLLSAVKRLSSESPLVVIDVGARNGLHAPWREIESAIATIGFEPDQRSFDELQRQPAAGQRVMLPVALYSEKGKRELYLTRDEGDSSLLRPNRAFVARYPRCERFDVVGTLELEVETLDAVLAAEGIADVDFMKLDTQGSEYFILQGAAKTLETQALGVEIEVEFARVYEQQPLFGEVDTLMKAAGFEIFDLRPVYWKHTVGQSLGGPKGRMVWGDALYLRSPESLRELLTALEPVAARQKAIHAALVPLVYGYVDAALQIIDDQRQIFAAADLRAVRAAIADASPRALLPAFPGKRLLARAVQKAWHLLRIDTGQQIGSGETLGNLE